MKSFQKRLHYLPKIIIVIPLILLIAVILKNPNRSLKEMIFKPKTVPQAVPVTAENLDLDGEYICKTESMEAYLKNRKLFIKSLANGNRYLYSDDCLYTWKDKSYGGGKYCGLSPYISLLENLNNLKLLNLDTIISSIFPENKNERSTQDIEKLLQSCSKTTVENVKVFELPKDVLFKNTEKPWLRPTFPNSALE